MSFTVKLEKKEKSDDRYKRQQYSSAADHNIIILYQEVNEPKAVP